MTKRTLINVDNLEVEGNLRVHGTTHQSTTILQSIDGEIFTINNDGTDNNATLRLRRGNVLSGDITFDGTDIVINRPLNISTGRSRIDITGNVYASDGTVLINRATKVIDLSSIDTDNLSEGTTNLYFTNARARTAISVASGQSALTYNNATGVLTYNPAGSLPNHDDLTGFVENEHIDHSAVTLTAGNGLTGGGDITASRTFSIDLADNSGLTVGADGLAIDTSAIVGASTAQSISGTKTFTGTINVPNAALPSAYTGPYSTSSGSPSASTDYVDQSIANLVGTADSALDTLQEISTALSNDADVVTNLINRQTALRNRNIIAGDGLIGGGNLNADITLDVDASSGGGMTINPDGIAVDNTVVRTLGNQNIDGRKTFTGTLVLPGTTSTTANAVFINDGNAFVRIGSQNLQITPTESVGTVASVGSTASTFPVYAGSRTVGNTVTHGIKRLRSGSFISINDASNVITIDAVSSQIQTTARSAISGGTGISYNSTTGVISLSNTSFGGWRFTTSTSGNETVSNNELVTFSAGTNMTITHTGNVITFSTSGTVGISSVSADTNPSLGGDLGLNSHDIVGTGDINITGDITITGDFQSDVFRTNSTANNAISISGTGAIGRTTADSIDFMTVQGNEGISLQVHPSGDDPDEKIRIRDDGIRFNESYYVPQQITADDVHKFLAVPPTGVTGVDDDRLIWRTIEAGSGISIINETSGTHGAQGTGAIDATTTISFDSSADHTFTGTITFNSGDDGFSLPSDRGTDGYFLQTDGDGVTTWAAVTSGTTYTAGNGIDITSGTISLSSTIAGDRTFSGNVSTANLTIGSSTTDYTFPSARADSANQILQTNASGELSWIDTPVARTDAEIRTAISGGTVFFNTGTNNFSLPSDRGTSGYFLQTDGASGTSWQPAPTGGITSISGNLSGDLILNNFDITGTGDIDITGDASISGNLTIGSSTTDYTFPSARADSADQILQTNASGELSWIDTPVARTDAEIRAAISGGTVFFNTGTNNFSLPSDRGTSGYFLQTDGDGTTSWVNAPTGGGTTTGISNLIEDTTPQLGGNLDLNNFDITGTGDIDITGNASISGTITFGSGATDYILPDERGAAGEVLTVPTNGNVLTWSAVSSGTTYTAGSGIDIASGTISLSSTIAGDRTFSGNVSTANLTIGSSTTDYTFPSARADSANQILQTNATGELSWIATPVARTDAEIRTAISGGTVLFNAGDDSFSLPSDRGTSGYFLQTDGSGVTTWQPAPTGGGGGGTTTLSGNLVGDLILNSHDITGTGNIDITGRLESTSFRTNSTANNVISLTGTGAIGRTTADSIDFMTVQGNNGISLQVHPDGDDPDEKIRIRDDGIRFNESYYIPQQITADDVNKFLAVPPTGETGVDDDRLIWRTIEAGSGISIINETSGIHGAQGTGSIDATTTISLDSSADHTFTGTITFNAGNDGFSLPSDRGTDGYFLRTGGDGVTTWAAVSSGTTYTAGNGIDISSGTISLDDDFTVSGNIAADGFDVVSNNANHDNAQIRRTSAGHLEVSLTNTSHTFQIMSGTRNAFRANSDGVYINNTDSSSGFYALPPSRAPAAGRVLTSTGNHITEWTEVFDGWRFTTTGTAENVADNELVTFTGADNITISHSGKTITFTGPSDADIRGAMAGGTVFFNAGNNNFSLPSDRGTDGYFLQTDGDGVTTWAAVTSGTTYTAGSGIDISSGTISLSSTIAGDRTFSGNVTTANLTIGSSTTDYTFPSARADSANQILQTNASGELSWIDTPAARTDAEIRTAISGGTVFFNSGTNNFSLPSDRGTDGYFLQTGGDGTTSWVTAPTGGTTTLSGNLSGDLVLSGHDITGSGDINISGTIQSSSIETGTANVFSLTVDRFFMSSPLTLGYVSNRSFLSAAILTSQNRVTDFCLVSGDTEAILIRGSDHRITFGRPQSGTDTASYTFPAGRGTSGYFLQTDGAGELSWQPAPSGGTSGISNLIEDTTPQLGGNLDLNSNDITGTGNIDITGRLESTSFRTNSTANNVISLTGTGAIGRTTVDSIDFMTVQGNDGISLQVHPDGDDPDEKIRIRDDGIRINESYYLPQQITGNDANKFLAVAPSSQAGVDSDRLIWKVVAGDTDSIATTNIVTGTHGEQGTDPINAAIEFALASTVSSDHTFSGTITFGSGTTDYILPDERGAAGEVLTVPTTGNTLIWTAVSSGTTYTAGNGIDISSGTISLSSTIAGDRTFSGNVSTANLTIGSGATDYTFPSARADSADQILQTNASGELSWIATPVARTDAEIRDAISGGTVFFNSGTNNFSLPSDRGTSGYFLQTDGDGATTWAAVSSGGITSLSGNLAGDLVLNSHDITGTGNIDITGDITASANASFRGGEVLINQHTDNGAQVVAETFRATGSSPFVIQGAGAFRTEVVDGNSFVVVQGNRGVTIEIENDNNNDNPDERIRFDGTGIRINNSYYVPQQIETGDVHKFLAVPPTGVTGVDDDRLIWRTIEAGSGISIINDTSGTHGTQGTGAIDATTTISLDSTADHTFTGNVTIGSGTTDYILPDERGDPGEVLTVPTTGNVLTWSAVSSGGITSLSGNLAGDLVLNGHDITGTGDIDISGSFTLAGTANVRAITINHLLLGTPIQIGFLNGESYMSAGVYADGSISDFSLVSGSTDAITIKGANQRVTFGRPTTGTDTSSYTFPSARPIAADQILQSDAGGELSWIPTPVPRTDAEIRGAISGGTVTFNSGDDSFSLPADRGTSGYFLQTDGASGTSWQSAVTSLSGNLAGDLVLNNHDITGTGNITITGNATLAGTVSINAGANSYVMPSDRGTDGYFLRINGNEASWQPVPTGGTTSLSGNLAGDLVLNSHDITGTGNVDITGRLESTSFRTNSTANNVISLTGTGAIGRTTVDSIDFMTVQGNDGISLQVHPDGDDPDEKIRIRDDGIRINESYYLPQQITTSDVNKFLAVPPTGETGIDDDRLIWRTIEAGSGISVTHDITGTHGAQGTGAIDATTTISLDSAADHTFTGTITFNAGDDSFSLPSDRGTSGYFLQTDGNGVTTWAAVSSGTTYTAGSGIDIASGTISLSSTIAGDRTFSGNVSTANLTIGSSTTDYTFPSARADSADQILQTNASGELSWIATPVARTDAEIRDAISGGTVLFNAGDDSFSLPSERGTSGYFLQTDGDGTTSWVTAPSIPNPFTGNVMNSRPNGRVEAPRLIANGDNYGTFITFTNLGMINRNSGSGLRLTGSRHLYLTGGGDHPDAVGTAPSINVRHDGIRFNESYYVPQQITTGDVNKFLAVPPTGETGIDDDRLIWRTIEAGSGISVTHDITGTHGAQGTGSIDATTTISLDSTADHTFTGTITFNAGDDGFSLPSDRGTSGYVLQTDGSGSTSWQPVTGGGGTVTLSGNLAGDLMLNSHDIIGTGNIDITGEIRSAGSSQLIALSGRGGIRYNTTDDAFEVFRSGSNTSLYLDGPHQTSIELERDTTTGATGGRIVFNERYRFPHASGSVGQVLAIASVSGTVGTLEWQTPSSGGGGSLGGALTSNLSLSGHDIVGSGNIYVNGLIQGTRFRATVGTQSDIISMTNVGIIGRRLINSLQYLTVQGNNGISLQVNPSQGDDPDEKIRIHHDGIRFNESYYVPQQITADDVNKFLAVPPTGETGVDDDRLIWRTITGGNGISVTHEITGTHGAQGTGSIDATTTIALSGTITFNSGDDSFSLPSERGTSGYFLRADANGATSWQPAPSGGGGGTTYTAGSGIDIASGTISLSSTITGDRTFSGNVSTANLTIGSSTTDYTFPPARADGADQILQTNASGELSWIATPVARTDAEIRDAISGGTVLFNAGDDGFSLPANRGTSGYVLQTDGSGSTSWQPVTGGGGTVSLSGNLAGDLMLNGHNITGTGNVRATGFRSDGDDDSFVITGAGKFRKENVTATGINGNVVAVEGNIGVFVRITPGSGGNASPEEKLAIRRDGLRVNESYFLPQSIGAQDNAFLCTPPSYSPADTIGNALLPERLVWRTIDGATNGGITVTHNSDVNINAQGTGDINATTTIGISETIPGNHTFPGTITFGSDATDYVFPPTRGTAGHVLTVPNSGNVLTWEPQTGANNKEIIYLKSKPVPASTITNVITASLTQHTVISTAYMVDWIVNDGLLTNLIPSTWIQEGESTDITRLQFQMLTGQPPTIWIILSDQRRLIETVRSMITLRFVNGPRTLEVPMGGDDSSSSYLWVASDSTKATEVNSWVRNLDFNVPIEILFVFAGSEPSAPDNSWGYDTRPEPANGLNVWYSSIPNLLHNEIMYRAERSIIGNPAQGDAVSDTWSDVSVIGSLGQPSGRLFADLILNEHDITGTGNISIIGNAALRGNVTMGVDSQNYQFPATRGAANEILQTDSSGVLSWVAQSNLAVGREVIYAKTIAAFPAESATIDRPLENRSRTTSSGGHIILGWGQSSGSRAFGDTFTFPPTWFTNNQPARLGLLWLERTADGTNRVNLQFINTLPGSSSSAGPQLKDGIRELISIRLTNGTRILDFHGIPDSTEPYRWTPTDQTAIRDFIDNENGSIETRLRFVYVGGGALPQPNNSWGYRTRPSTGSALLAWYQSAPNLLAGEHLWVSERQINGQPTVGSAISASWTTAARIGGVGVDAGVNGGHLGANLNLNNFDITGTGNISIIGNVSIGTSSTTTYTLPPARSSQSGYVLTAGANGVTAWAAIPQSSQGAGGASGSSTSELVHDTSPQLGGDLDLNSNNITGNGSININGSIFTGLALRVGSSTTHYTFPAQRGTSGYFLRADADGATSWAAIPASGMTEVVQDTSPQLGGNLDLNSQDITGTGNVNITGDGTFSGNVTIGASSTNYVLPSQRGTADQYLKAGTNGTTSWETLPPSGISEISHDTSPQLGADLDLNGFGITGTGRVVLSGSMTATGTLSLGPLGTNYTLPHQRGTAGEYLVAGANGTVTWAAAPTTGWSFRTETSTVTNVSGGDSLRFVGHNNIDVTHSGNVITIDGLSTTQIRGAFVAGTGININNGTITATGTAGSTSTDLILDTSPQLGADLQLNDYSIRGTGNISINGVFRCHDLTDGFRLTGVGAMHQEPNPPDEFVNYLDIHGVDGLLMSIGSDNDERIRITPDGIRFNHSYCFPTTIGTEGQALVVGDTDMLVWQTVDDYDHWRFTTDSDGNENIINDELLTFTGGTGIDVTHSGSTITISYSGSTTLSGNLAGDIVLNNHDITGTGEINVNGNIATRTLRIGTPTSHYFFPNGRAPGENYIMQSNASGQLSWIPTPTGTGSATLSGNLVGDIVLNNHDITGTGNITIATGNVTADYFHGIATSAQFADLAENYVADGEYENGTVLILGGEQEVTTTDIAETHKVAGVVSTNPAYLMNKNCEGNHVVAIALRGRVPCKVIGPVEKGDLLVTSKERGFAKASNNPPPHSVIGKAIENKTDSGKGIIEILI